METDMPAILLYGSLAANVVLVCLLYKEYARSYMLEGMVLYVWPSLNAYVRHMLRAMAALHKDYTEVHVSDDDLINIEAFENARAEGDYDDIKRHITG